MNYLVMAFRYGTNEYIFPVGIFDDKDVAIKAAKDHHMFRGGKYDHKLYYITPGKEYDACECESDWITGQSKN